MRLVDVYDCDDVDKYRLGTTSSHSHTAARKFILGLDHLIYTHYTTKTPIISIIICPTGDDADT